MRRSVAIAALVVAVGLGAGAGDVRAQLFGRKLGETLPKEPPPANRYGPGRDPKAPVAPTTASGKAVDPGVLPEAARSAFTREVERMLDGARIDALATGGRFDTIYVATGYAIEGEQGSGARWVITVRFDTVARLASEAGLKGPPRPVASREPVRQRFRIRWQDGRLAFEEKLRTPFVRPERSAAFLSIAGR